MSNRRVQTLPRKPCRAFRAAARACRRPVPHRLALALWSASLLSLATVDGLQAQVLPSGPVVVHGTAQVTTTGSQMTVVNSNNAILNWKSFSIGTSNGVHFAQPGTTSKVLNRVTGSDPSSILGSLTSNGQVWLLNPNGVLFGKGARVDVAGLVTSTLHLNDDDWLAGRNNFLALPGAAAGSIVNQGELRTALGGRVALVGSSAGVTNAGVIDAPGGQVILAAGQSVDLVDTGAPNVAVRVTAPQGEVLNVGQLLADGGRIDVHAAIVNQQGLVRADSLHTGAGGEVVLRASEALNLAGGTTGSEQGSRVTLESAGSIDIRDAKVAAGGDIVITADGNIVVDHSQVRAGSGYGTSLDAGNVSIRSVYGDVGLRSSHVAGDHVRFAAGGSFSLIEDDGAVTLSPTPREHVHARLVSIRADEVVLGQGVRIVASGEGDAITIAGRLGPAGTPAGNTRRFVNQNDDGQLPLSTPRGRWLIYARVRRPMFSSPAT